MKRMTAKRLISASLVTVLSAGLLAGCGSDTSEESSSDGGETTITFGIHVANPEEQETVTYNIVQEFNKQYEGQYKVEFEAADTETHSKNLKLQSTDGTLPDIFWVDAAEAPEYAESGVLMDLSDYLSENTDIDEALMEWKTDTITVRFSMGFLISVMFRDFSIIKNYLTLQG